MKSAPAIIDMYLSILVYILANYSRSPSTSCPLTSFPTVIPILSSSVQTISQL